MLLIKRKMRISPANGSGVNGFSGSGCLLGLIWMGPNGFISLSGWVC
jgi:hypothetical protein